MYIYILYIYNINSIKGLSSLDELANNVMSSAQDVEMEESGGGGKYVDDIILDQTQVWQHFSYPVNVIGIYYL